MTHSHRSNLPEAAGNPCRGEPCPAVGAALRRAETPALDREAQYLRDLEVIERCEQQIEHEAGCPEFFLCMADLAGRRAP